MLSINTNLSSYIAQSSLRKSSDILNTAIERMSTGYKINHAGDNAANYSIATTMSSQISAYDVAEDNVAMGMDMIATANSCLESMQNNATRLRALCVQAQNGTYGQQSIDAMNKEATAIISEMYREYSTTEYNERSLFIGDELVIPEGMPKARGGSFINEFQKVDTSEMERLSETEYVQGGTYAIDSIEDLQALKTITAAGNSQGSTFVLTNDIDLSTAAGFSIGSYTNPFKGTLNGNGHKITNGTTHLFTCSGGTIKNLGLKNFNVSGDSRSGCLVRWATGGWIDNCFVTDSNVYGTGSVGLLVGQTWSLTITNSYSSGTVSGGNSAEAGGLVGAQISGTKLVIRNSYSNADVVGTVKVNGGLFGSALTAEITNSYATGNVGNATNSGCFGGKISTSITVTNCAAIEQGGKAMIASGADEASSSVQALKTGTADLNFQVGIDSSDSSRITFRTGFESSVLDDIYGIDVSELGSIEKIDKFLTVINEKQTEYGAITNRFESALEEISVKRDNLVSSRSTLKDADIAKVSSDYIRGQILQQAAATLLSTANQSPAIALQLI